MPFMQPEIFECDFWIVETSIGTEIVPCDVEKDRTKLAPYVEGTITDHPDDAVTGTRGWLGRLSAPGYMDCTDYVTGETEQEVKEALADMHDLCPVCLDELDEDYKCTECAEEDES